MAKSLAEPFNAAACAAMRKYRQIRADAIVKKGKLTKERDGTQKDIDACTDQQKKRKAELKEVWYDCVHDIRKCNDIIDACEGKIMEMIEQGDQMELIPNINPNPTLRTLFAKTAAAEDGDDEDDPDTKDPDER